MISSVIGPVDSSLLLTAWLTGLLGGTHCIGMCGGISAALTFALPAEQRQGRTLLGYQLAYNIGRLLTYVLFGVIVGTLGQTIIAPVAGLMWLRLVAGLLMVAMGLYLAGWWMGLQRLERLGSGLWQHLDPLRRRLLPVNHPLKAVAAGMAWGFLPCGLVYSALALALARSDSVMSGAVMLAFGLGTLPFLLITGTLAGRLRQWLQQRAVRQAAGLLVIAFGIWTALPALPGGGHHAHNGAAGETAPGTDPHAGHDKPATKQEMPAGHHH
ncbi:MAG: sulfite exporter TauE/SafE family protein [Moraxellaceae bacterium]|nr:sulfite exporter TauE/SafE family protein [Moraxellaceae bacterium]